MLAWAAAGACLSPVLGVPLWSVTEGSRFADFVPLISAVCGAAAGILALVVGPEWLRSSGSTSFALAYPATLGLWMAVTGSTWGLLFFTLRAAVATAVVIVRYPRPPRARVRSLLAVAVWVLATLLMLAQFFGLVLVPLGVALSLNARQTSRAEIHLKGS